MNSKIWIALAAALSTFLSPVVHADSRSAWDIIKEDLAQIGRVADADFWRGIYDVGTSVDFNIDTTGMKVSDASLGLVAGSSLTTYGVIKDLAMRKYPELSVADATELYGANLKRRMLQFVAKNAPRLYTPPAGVNLAEELILAHAPTRRFGGLIDHPWTNRVVFIGGGSAISIVMIAYLAMIAKFHPNFQTDGALQDEINQLAHAGEAIPPLDLAALTDEDYRKPETLIRLLGENQSSDTLAQLALAHPQLGFQIHDLARLVTLE